MAAQGRNNDSMLVHMTPREVNGLHALAVANGGSLTINPETGLPEAGFLEDLLPAVIGFGLDTFVPGLGEAVGGMFGLGAAAGTGIAVGGLTGLATGSLSKGVMAGFGAYGGAGLAEGLMGAGAGDIASKTLAEQQAAGTFPTLAGQSPEQIAAYVKDVDAARSAALSGISPMDKLTAGFSATTQNPAALGAFAKDNWKNFMAAGAPALMGLSTQDQTVTKMPDDRMITPFVMNQRYVPRNESLSPSAQQRHITYGVTPITPVHAANGGAVSTFDEGGSVGRDAYGREVGDPDFGKPSDRYEGITVQGGFDRYGNLNGTDAARRAMLNSSPPGGGYSGGYSGGGRDGSGGGGDGHSGDTDEYTRLLLNAAAPRRTYQNTMTGDSAKAYDYLMGYTPATTTTNRTAQVRAPGVALTTAAPAALTTDQVGAITSRSGHAIDAFGYGNPLANGIPGATTNQYGDSGPTTGLASLANSLSATLGNWGNDVNPATGLKDTGIFNTISNALARNIDPNYGHEAAVGMRQAAANQAAAIAAQDAADAATRADAQATRGDGLGNPGGGGGGAAGLGGSGAGGTGPGSMGAGGGPGSTGTGSGVGTGGVGPTCFVKGVIVTLANGSKMAIEDVAVGDFVLGQNGPNQVIAYDRPQLIIPDVRDGTLYGINGAEKFMTSEHPVMTKAGWKAIDQENAKKFEPHLSDVLVGNLEVGDELVMEDGTYTLISSIEKYTDQPQQQLYNFMLDGDHTYYVNGILVHNKGDGGGGGDARGGFLNHGQFDQRYAYGGGIDMLAGGGLGSLGGYSDGGRLLRGPGDGVSDSIPATIGQHQPARLADGEFVVPARIVSELGNGSTEAGARQLYAMMDRIQAGRKKTMGKNKVAANTRAAKHLPA